MFVTESEESSFLELEHVLCGNWHTPSPGPFASVSPTSHQQARRRLGPPRHPPGGQALPCPHSEAARGRVPRQ